MKTYFPPLMELLNLGDDDVITSSGGAIYDTGGDDDGSGDF